MKCFACDSEFEETTDVLNLDTDEIAHVHSIILKGHLYYLCPRCAKIVFLSSSLGRTMSNRYPMYIPINPEEASIV